MKPPLSILILAISWVVAASRFPKQTISDSIFVSYCNLHIAESSQPLRPFNYASIGTILSFVSPIERDLDANHFARFRLSEMPILRQKERVDYRGLCNERGYKLKLDDKWILRKRKRHRDQRVNDRPRKKRRFKAKSRRFVHKKKSRFNDPKYAAKRAQIAAERQSENASHLDTVRQRIKTVMKSKGEWKQYDLLRRYMVLQMYYSMLSHDVSKMEIYEQIRMVHEYSHQSVIDWVREFESNGFLEPSKQGDHPKIPKGLDSIELQAQFKAYLDSQIKKKQHFAIQDVAKWVNDTLLNDKVKEKDNQPFSVSTVTQWAKDLGYSYGKHSKTVYIDGHEREDVIKVLYFLMGIKS